MVTARDANNEFPEGGSFTVFCFSFKEASTKRMHKMKRPHSILTNLRSVVYHNYLHVVSKHELEALSVKLRTIRDLGNLETN